MKLYKVLYKKDIVRQVKICLSVLLYVTAALEIFFFPSLDNIFGCLMAFVSLKIFNLLFTYRLVTQFPFAFLMFLSMFLYRYLPLVATLIEGKPISYKLELPATTFLLETFSFLIAGLALYFATNVKQNSLIQKKLYKLGFFEISPKILWWMGGLGILVRLYTLQSSNLEYGDVVNKFISGLSYFIMAPICLLFPSLLKIKEHTNKNLVVIYIVVVFIINIASNSREQILSPIFVYIILFFLNIVVTKKAITDIISPLKLTFIIIFLIFGLNFLSDISIAMLANRGIRSDVSKNELFKNTIDTYLDKNQMAKLKMLANDQEKNTSGYSMGWTESYLDNFMFNRYANILISDQTLFYADKIGYGNSKMIEDFFDKALVIFPEPLLKLVDINIDKENFLYSRGDYLYSLNTGDIKGGFKVTSHVGDGLATFGYLYFPLQFALWFLVFMLLNTFVIYTKYGTVFSSYGLMNVFIFVGMFRNAQGCLGDLTFILRGYFQGVFTYLIILWFLKKIHK